MQDILLPVEGFTQKKAENLYEKMFQLLPDSVNNIATELSEDLSEVYRLGDLKIALLVVQSGLRVFD